MKVKLVAVLAVISILLIAVALQRQGSDRVDDLQSRQLLSEEQLALVNQLDSLVLAKADVEVEVVRDNGRWGVVSKDLFPAQPERVAALLHAVRGARVTEAQTDNPEYHARLGLDLNAPGDSTLQVTLNSAEGSVGIIFGNQVGGGQVARFAHEDQVWLINRPFSMTVNDVEWLDLQVTQIPMTQAASARWIHADGEMLELEKTGEGDYNFRLAGLKGAQQQGNERWINSMVLALIDLRAQDVKLRSELELDEPMLQMQVATWSGAELEASLYDVDGRYWLLVDRFEQSEESNLGVNADKRWAFQLGIGQVENLNKRQSDIVRGTEAE
ncbi:DUF4340 domain-containing protein [Halopseudomonas pelagia]|uniref:DUF4340 domain-containing protein n=1 Tax=Halopseudomonas pelagia TaxID=553151 RepID=UPI0030D88D1E|tara:strand:+ start:511 stop:1494 length:984 start_codon:yes stop_codon:yes gene_type:complete